MLEPEVVIDRLVKLLGDDGYNQSATTRLGVIRNIAALVAETDDPDILYNLSHYINTRSASHRYMCRLEARSC